MALRHVLDRCPDSLHVLRSPSVTCFVYVPDHLDVWQDETLLNQ